MGFLGLFSTLFGCTHGQKPNRANTTDDIVRFYWSHNSMNAEDCYSFTCQRNDTEVTWEYEGVNDKFHGKIFIDDLLAVQKVFADNKVANWNGFHGINNMVLDGTGYSLNVEYADGSSSSSSGSNNFPTGYGNVENIISDLKSKLVKDERQKVRDAQYANGSYSGELRYISLHFKQQGTGGHDDYSILIRDKEQWGNDVEITVKSLSGEFLPVGEYSLRTDTKDTTKIRKEIADIFLKYEVGKWDGWDKADKDYNNSEWFQFDVEYPSLWLDCYGTAHPAHYDDVRKEVLKAVCECYKEQLMNPQP